MSTISEIDRDIKSLSEQIESNNKSIEELKDTNQRLNGTVSLLKWKRSQLEAER